MADRPNILYLHSHDTGRYVQPYGHQVRTPNIQRLADQGMLFREAFCAAPTCSGSRACLLTGQWAHSNGMTGLAHRGWTLNDYGHHIVHTLRGAGYWSGLIGEQHLSVDPGILGYDRVVDIDTTRVESVVPAAVALLRERPPQPFFLSVGFFETHREYLPSTSIRDRLYSLPPDNLPDTPEMRQDMASYKASARSLDQGVGAVLNALDEQNIADDTLVILTTDHELPVLANIDDGPTKDLFVAAGWGDRPLPRDALYDLLFDPSESHNLADEAAHLGVLAELQRRLETWMRETEDPLLDGDIDPPPGAMVNYPNALSASDPHGVLR